MERARLACGLRITGIIETCWEGGSEKRATTCNCTVYLLYVMRVHDRRVTVPLHRSSNVLPGTEALFCIENEEFVLL